MILATILSQAESVASNHDQIMLALIALVATSIAALAWVIRNGRYAKGVSEDAATAAEQATAANSAVNNVGPGQHRLYDKIESMQAKIEDIANDVTENKNSLNKVISTQEEFSKHGWNNLPVDLADGVALTMTIRDIQNASKKTDSKLDIVIAELREHVAWEMNAKYASNDKNS